MNDNDNRYGHYVQLATIESINLHGNSHRLCKTVCVCVCGATVFYGFSRADIPVQITFIFSTIKHLNCVVAQTLMWNQVESTVRSNASESSKMVYCRAHTHTQIQTHRHTNTNTHSNTQTHTAAQQNRDESTYVVIFELHVTAADKH